MFLNFILKLFTYQYTAYCFEIIDKFW